MEMLAYLINKLGCFTFHSNRTWLKIQNMGNGRRMFRVGMDKTMPFVERSLLFLLTTYMDSNDWHTHIQPTLQIFHYRKVIVFFKLMTFKCEREREREEKINTFLSQIQIFINIQSLSCWLNNM